MTKHKDEEIDLQEKVKKAEEEAKEVEENNGELENLKEELEKMTELAQRTMADFQNYKRRRDEEQGLMAMMANIGLIKSLLPVLDNLERSKNEWSQGIEMCVKQFKEVLKNSGLEEIESEGVDFNPDYHEALLEGQGEQDKVIEVLEKGYKLGDRVIRHAKVKVGNGQ